MKKITLVICFCINILMCFGQQNNYEMQIGSIAQKHLTQKARYWIKEFIRDSSLALASKHLDVKDSKVYHDCIKLNFFDKNFLKNNYNEFSKIINSDTTRNIYKLYTQSENNLKNVNLSFFVRSESLKLIIRILIEIHNTSLQKQIGNNIKKSFTINKRQINAPLSWFFEYFQIKYESNYRSNFVSYNTHNTNLQNINFANKRTYLGGLRLAKALNKIFDKSFVLYPANKSEGEEAPTILSISDVNTLKIYDNTTSGIIKRVHQSKHYKEIVLVDANDDSEQLKLILKGQAVSSDLKVGDKLTFKGKKSKFKNNYVVVISYPSEILKND